MKKSSKIVGSVVLSALLVASFSGCGSDSSSPAVYSGSDSYKVKFLAQSESAQTEELFGGIIGITDEVGNGKMGDPLGASAAQADTTLVESQFSWNSTMDFYNNILSIKNIWDGGLKNIVNNYDSATATDIDTKLNAALASTVAISDENANGILTTSDLTANNGAMAFRNQIVDPAGRALIETTVDKLAELQTAFETLKSNITVDSTDKADLTDIVNNVIVKGYNDLGVEADKLSAALTALKTTPTAANVTAARNQWRAARVFWEAGEGHIFGPVDTLGVDPKVDSWPVDKTTLDGALGGWDPALSNIDGFPVTMKGFHAIEYLLFGDGATLETEAVTLANLDADHLAYLEALGISFAKDIKQLTDAWK